MTCGSRKFAEARLGSTRLNAFGAGAEDGHRTLEQLTIYQTV